MIVFAWAILLVAISVAPILIGLSALRHTSLVGEGGDAPNGDAPSANNPPV